MDVDTAALGDHPEFIPVVAGWHWREWGHTDPAGSQESWTAGLAAQAAADQVPGTLIALVDGSPAGVVCLVARDMPGYQPAARLSPWLKGLYVIPAARRRGLGELLVRRCQAWASSLGFDALHLYTERSSAARALYERMDWQVIHQAHYEGIDATVMRTFL
jgi:GNAT superfamily N-acetyltransferase